MSAEQHIGEELLRILQADPGVQAIFGQPARVIDSDSEAPMLPFAQIETHSVRPLPTAGGDAYEHTITLGVTSRAGGLREARAGLAALRKAIEGAYWAIPRHDVVLAQTLFADAMRRGDRRAFRGIIRFRIISEETQ